MTMKDTGIEVLDIKVARDIYPKLFAEGKEGLRGEAYAVFPMEPGKRLLDRSTSVTYGSSNLLSDPLQEAFIRNLPILCGLGFRIREHCANVQLELIEGLRLEAPITAPSMVQKQVGGPVALLVGTLAVVPLHYSRRETQVRGLPIDHNWRTENLDGAIFLCQPDTWQALLPEPLQREARNVVDDYATALGGEILRIKSQPIFRYCPQALHRLMDQGYVTDGERCNCLNSLRDNKLLVRERELSR